MSALSASSFQVSTASSSSSSLSSLPLLSSSSLSSSSNYLKSDYVLERTHSIANSYESTANLEQLNHYALHNAALVAQVKNEQIFRSKLDALIYSHRLTVVEKRFRTLNESAEKLFFFMADLALQVLATSHLKEIMYQYRNMCSASSNPKAFSEFIRHITQSILKISKTIKLKNNQNNKINQMFSVTQMAFKTYKNLKNKDNKDDNSQQQNDFAKIKYNQDLFQFCKETLKNVLEVTRKLEQYENEYHEIAQNLIDLILKFRNKEEMRRLYMTLKSHMNQILAEDEANQLKNDANNSNKLNKQQDTNNNNNDSTNNTATNNNSRSVRLVSMNSVKTLQLNLKTKLSTYQACLALDLWREAFFALEDTQQIMSYSNTLSHLNAPKIWFDFLNHVVDMCLKSTSRKAASSSSSSSMSLLASKEQLATFSLLQKIASLTLFKAFEIMNRAIGPSEKLKQQIAVKAFILTITISDRNCMWNDKCSDDDIYELNEIDESLLADINSDNYQSNIQRSKTKRLLHLIKVRPDTKISRSHLLERIYESQIMSFLPESFKKLNDMLKNKLNLPSGLREIAGECANYFENVKDGHFYVERLHESLMVHSLQLILSAYSSIDLLQLQTMVPFNTNKCNEQLEILIDIANHLGIRLKLVKLDSENYEITSCMSHMDQILDNNNNTNSRNKSLIDSPEFYITKIYKELDDLVDEIGLKDIISKKKGLYESIYLNYLNQKESREIEIKQRSYCLNQQEFEKLERLRAKELQAKAEERQREENILIQQKLENDKLKAIQEEEKHNLVKEALRIKETEKMIKEFGNLNVHVPNTVNNDKLLTSSSDVDKSLEKIMSIKMNKEFERIEKQIKSAEQAEKNTNYFARKLMANALKAKESNDLNSNEENYFNNATINDLNLHFDTVFHNRNSIEGRKEKRLKELKEKFSQLFAMQKDTNLRQINRTREEQFEERLRQHEEQKKELSHLKLDLERMNEEMLKKKKEDDEKAADVILRNKEISNNNSSNAFNNKISNDSSNKSTIRSVNQNNSNQLTRDIRSDNASEKSYQPKSEFISHRQKAFDDGRNQNFVDKISNNDSTSNKSNANAYKSRAFKRSNA